MPSNGIIRNHRGNFFSNASSIFCKEQNTLIYECTSISIIHGFIFCWFGIFSPSLLNTTFCHRFCFHHSFFGQEQHRRSPKHPPGKVVCFRLGFLLTRKFPLSPGDRGSGEAMVRSWSGNQIEAWRSDGRKKAIDWWMILRFVWNNTPNWKHTPKKTLDQNRLIIWRDSFHSWRCRGDCSWRIRSEDLDM